MPKRSKLFDETPVEEVKEDQVVEEVKEEEPIVEETPKVEETKKLKLVPEFGKVTASLLNVRKEPNGEIVKTLKANEQVSILGEEGDWYMIDNGYVMKQYIQKI